MVAASSLGYALAAVVTKHLPGLLVMFTLLVPAEAQAEDYYALVITGASGNPTYASTYTRWRQDLVDVLRTQPGFSDDHLIVLGDTPGPGVGTASKDGVVDAFARLRQTMTTESVLLVLLMGHGTYDGVDAKFNLVGPDLGVEAWDRLLDGLPGRAVFVNTTASSFPFVATLARPGRVVITATASSVQRYDTVFPSYFVRAFASPEADADKDGRVSVWEAFSASSEQVRQWYQREGRLATERALLDDSGDGVGADAQEPGGDGHLAARIFVGAGVGESSPETDPALAPLVAEREALQEQVAALKAQKGSISSSTYRQELERLLIDLARVSRDLRHAVQEL